MTRRNYSNEVKAQVMAALLTGQSVNAVAREFGIPKGTVSNWKRRKPSLDDTQKKDVGELLIQYLRSNLEAQQVQTEFFKDKNWLRKQSASELGVLHGILNDKSNRLIEALDAGTADD